MLADVTPVGASENKHGRGTRVIALFSLASLALIALGFSTGTLTFHPTIPVHGRTSDLLQLAEFDTGPLKTSLTKLVNDSCQAAQDNFYDKHRGRCIAMDWIKDVGEQVESGLTNWDFQDKYSVTFEVSGETTFLSDTGSYSFSVSCRNKMQNSKDKYSVPYCLDSYYNIWWITVTTYLQVRPNMPKIDARLQKEYEKLPDGGGCSTATEQFPKGGEKSTGISTAADCRAKCDVKGDCTAFEFGGSDCILHNIEIVSTNKYPGVDCWRLV